MLFPWYAATMLVIEAQAVIGQRMMKLAEGGQNACDETVLMINEKIHAACEAGVSIMTGGSAASIIGRYREHVAANAGRLA